MAWVRVQAPARLEAVKCPLQGRSGSRRCPGCRYRPGRSRCRCPGYRRRVDPRPPRPAVPRRDHQPGLVHHRQVRRSRSEALSARCLRRPEGASPFPPYRREPHRSAACPSARIPIGWAWFATVPMPARRWSSVPRVSQRASAPGWSRLRRQARSEKAAPTVARTEGRAVMVGLPMRHPGSGPQQHRSSLPSASCPPRVAMTCRTRHRDQRPLSLALAWSPLGAVTGPRLGLGRGPPSREPRPSLLGHRGWTRSSSRFRATVPIAVPVPGPRRWPQLAPGCWWSHPPRSDRSHCRRGRRDRPNARSATARRCCSGLPSRGRRHRRAPSRPRCRRCPGPRPAGLRARHRCVRAQRSDHALRRRDHGSSRDAR